MYDNFNSMIEDLYERGWSVQQHFMSFEYLSELLNEANLFWQNGKFHKAQIGSGTNKTLRPEIRSDHILWLQENNLTELQQVYWNRMFSLQSSLNEAFYLGLNDFEAHFAVYPPDSFYKKHLDQFKRVKERFISCILYLNENWSSSFGGQLRIYPTESDDQSYFDILPEFGTFVCFRSDLIYHEVLKSSKTRFSLTAWHKRI